MKCCSKCGVEKHLFDFHKNKTVKDGHQARCKDCAKANSIAHRAENIDHARAYDKNRDKSEERRESLRKRIAANLSIYPERNRAKRAVFVAIRAGNLMPLPCSVCGQEKVDAHHPDYDRPLDVVWLCRSHHMMIHAAAM